MRPAYVVAFLLLATWYAGCLYPALIAAAFALWLGAPAVALTRVSRVLANLPGARR